MNDYLNKLEEQITKITEEIVDELNNEDWSVYTHQDIYEVAELLYGQEHPLIIKFKQLDNKITEEVK